MMKKMFKFYAICWAILLALFNLIVFLTPNEIAGISKFNGSFWVGYVFITLSFIGQLVCARLAFKQESLQKFFYNVSLITVSYSATIVSVVIGALCMAIPVIPTWVGTIVCLLLLALSAVSVLKAKAAIDIVSAVDKNVKEQTFFIKSLTVNVETLMAKAKSDFVKMELKKVCEVVRYSDPMSNNALSGIEAQIILKFNALSQAVEADHAEEVQVLAEELSILVNERNKRCKLLK